MYYFHKHKLSTNEEVKVFYQIQSRIGWHNNLQEKICAVKKEQKKCRFIERHTKVYEFLTRKTSIKKNYLGHS